MDKFSGLFVKSNGEWALHGTLDSDVKGKIDALKSITDNGGKIGNTKGQIKAEAVAVIHSTKGLLRSRKF